MTKIGQDETKLFMGAWNVSYVLIMLLVATNDKLKQSWDQLISSTGERCGNYRYAQGYVSSMPVNAAIGSSDYSQDRPRTTN